MSWALTVGVGAGALLPRAGAWMDGVKVFFGIVLLVAPVVGAVVLTWWLGAYAIVFGVFLLVLAFQLHGMKEEQATAKAPAKRAPRKAPAKKKA